MVLLPYPTRFFRLHVLRGALLGKSKFESPGVSQSVFAALKAKCLFVYPGQQLVHLTWLLDRSLYLRLPCRETDRSIFSYLFVELKAHKDNLVGMRLLGVVHSHLEQGIVVCSCGQEGASILKRGWCHSYGHLLFFPASLIILIFFCGLCMFRA